MGAVGGLTALMVWEVLGLPGVVAAAAAAVAAMALATVHALLEPAESRDAQRGPTPTG